MHCSSITLSSSGATVFKDNEHGEKKLDKKVGNHAGRCRVCVWVDRKHLIGPLWQPRLFDHRDLDLARVDFPEKKSGTRSNDILILLIPVFIVI